MKKLILAIGAVLLASTVQAEKATCSDLHGLSEKIVKARYNGLTLDKMLAISADSEALKTLIIEAYSLPRLRVEENQVMQAQDFANSVMLRCLGGKG